MLGFRYACQKHQQMFSDMAAREGRSDPEQKKKVRCRLLAWLSVKCARLVTEQINSEARMGSAIEKARAQSEDCQ